MLLLSTAMIMIALEVAGPPPGLAEWARVLVPLFSAFGALVATVGLFAFRPMLRQGLVDTMRGCKAQIMELINEWYKERIEKVDAAVELTDAHTDQLEGLEAAIMAQGKALGEKLDGNAMQHTRAVEAIASTLEHMRREGAETAKSVKKVEGILEGLKMGGRIT